MVYRTKLIEQIDENGNSVFVPENDDDLLELAKRFEEQTMQMIAVMKKENSK